MSKPSNKPSFVVIGRNGLQTSIALQQLIRANYFPLAVWIEQIDSSLPALTEIVCQTNDIPFSYTQDFNSTATVSAILQGKPDFAIVAGLATIIKEPLLDNIPIANLHIGILPYYRGAHVNFWKMKAGEDRYGATVHKMEKAIDRGSIFAIQVFDAGAIIDGFELMRQNYILAGALLVDWMDRDNKWECVHPNSRLEGKGKYFPKFSEKDFHLDDNASVSLLYKQINRLRFYGASLLQVGEHTYETNRADLLSDQPVPSARISVRLVRDDYAVLQHPTGILGLHLNNTQ